MKDDQRHFLSLLSRPPARLTVEQAAWTLNCQAHDIPILVASRLLKPLGNPPPNGLKFFSAVEILELANDKSWLCRATDAIHEYWHAKNNGKKRPSLLAHNPPTSQPNSATLPLANPELPFMLKPKLTKTH